MQVSDNSGAILRNTNELNQIKSNLANVASSIDAPKAQASESKADVLVSVQAQLSKILIDTGKIADRIDNQIVKLTAERAKLNPLLDRTQKKVTKEAIQRLNVQKKETEEIAAYTVRQANRLEAKTAKEFRTEGTDAKTQGSPERLAHAAERGASNKLQEAHQLLKQIDFKGIKGDESLTSLLVTLAKTPISPDSPLAAVQKKVIEGIALQDMKAIIHANSRSDSYHPINFMSIKNLKIAGEALNQTNAPEFNALKSFVQEQLKEARKTFSANMAFISNLQPDQLKLVQLMGQGEHDKYELTPDQKKSALELAKTANEIYWAFSNPFENHVGLQNVSPIFKNASTDPDHPMHDIVKANQKLTETIEVLFAANKSIKEFSIGCKYSTLRKDHLPELVAFKKEYLSRLREANKQDTPIEVGIVGSGPGGLARALVAGIKGHNATIVEPRAFTRQNMIKLANSPLLEFFGLHDRLAQKGNILDKNPTSLDVELKDLQKVMEEAVQDLFKKDIKLEGKFINVVDYKEEAGDPLHAGILYQPTKMGGKESVGAAKPFSTDLVIDSSGARAIVAQSFLNQSISYSEPQTMIAAVLKQGVSAKPVKAGKSAVTIDKDFKLSNPEHDYVLIQPDGRTQRRIAELTSQKKEEELEALLLEVVSQQQGHQLTKNDFDQKPQPFKIEITEREDPSVIAGSTLVIETGDATATPDPKSGSGTGHAIMGSLPFSATLDHMRSGKTLREVKDHTDFGNQQITKQMIDQSFAARTELGDVGKGTETAAFILGKAVKANQITLEEQQLVERLLDKQNSNIPRVGDETQKLLALGQKIKELPPATSTNKKAERAQLEALLTPLLSSSN